MAPRLAELAVAGAGGGVVCWTVALPLDFAKTRLQVGAEAGSASVAGVLLDAVRAGGLRRIYVGYASALARGVPGAAVVFSVYGAVHERRGGGS